MTVTATTQRPTSRLACTTHPEVFQHPLVEEPPAASRLSAAERRMGAMLTERAQSLCLACPLLESCLYEAVVRHDVAGCVAGTTERQREQMRRLLGWRVDPEDLDSLAGCAGGGRTVDHAEVVRLRAAHPNESLEQIAQRLGCSLSTVKRHLRRARRGEVAAAEPLPPTRDQVMRAYASVVASRGRRAEQAA